MKVTQELKAKCALGEMTLGDVLKLVIPKTALIHVNHDGSDMGSYDIWGGDDESISLFDNEDSQEFDFCFDLNTKVKVKEECVEWEDDGVATCLTFLETKVVGFDSLLPRRSKK
jgi:hypothetical protein